MHAIIKNGRILIYDSYIFKESIKEIPERQWHPEEKAWSVPISHQNIETLSLLGCKLSDEILDMNTPLPMENIDDENILLPVPLKVSPYKHQLKGYNLACRSMGIIGSNGVPHGFALLMEMGTGKTITSIDIVGKAYLTGKIKRLLILAPKSIVSVWEDEFSKFASFPYSISVLTGTSAKKAEQLKTISHEGLEIAVMNYDSILQRTISALKRILKIQMKYIKALRNKVALMCGLNMPQNSERTLTADLCLRRPLHRCF